MASKKPSGNIQSLPQNGAHRSPRSFSKPKQSLFVQNIVQAHLLKNRKYSTKLPINYEKGSKQQYTRMNNRLQNLLIHGYNNWIEYRQATNIIQTSLKVIDIEFKDKDFENFEISDETLLTTIILGLIEWFMIVY